MKNKAVTFFLGAAVVAVLLVFLLLRAEPEKSSVVTSRSVSPPPGSTVGTLEQVPLDQARSQDKPVDYTAPSSPQHAPVLEPEIREALGEMLNTSSEGLVEETRNGVTSVDLQGRFQSVPVATIDEDGNVHITDYTHLPKDPKQP
ncbi:hypothetical protein MNBD_GAMMA15-2442 [hydrothermal vent metagenome]|uniref:Uncharacterized protein n=1 Tax=hydrothermal vent metagenome TaxID=652676 RepID=A0A3B0Y485_9ZZZZ